jgi:hypothetical protein
LVTYILLLSGLTAIPVGPPKLIGIVAFTVLSAVLIAVTEVDNVFAVYTVVPSGLAAMP